MGNKENKRSAWGKLIQRTKPPVGIGGKGNLDISTAHSIIK